MKSQTFKEILQVAIFYFEGKSVKWIKEKYDLQDKIVMSGKMLAKRYEDKEL